MALVPKIFMGAPCLYYDSSGCELAATIVAISARGYATVRVFTPVDKQYDFNVGNLEIYDDAFYAKKNCINFPGERRKADNKDKYCPEHTDGMHRISEDGDKPCICGYSIWKAVPVQDGN
jgi:hypothetical protein